MAVVFATRTLILVTAHEAIPRESRRVTAATEATRRVVTPRANIAWVRVAFIDIEARDAVSGEAYWAGTCEPQFHIDASGRSQTGVRKVGTIVNGDYKAIDHLETRLQDALTIHEVWRLTSEVALRTICTAWPTAGGACRVAREACIAIHVRSRRANTDTDSLAWEQDGSWLEARGAVAG